MNKSLDKNQITLSDGSNAFLYSDGVYCVNKIFFSAVNEEKWLNLVASQGLALCDRSFGRYFFSKNTQADKWYYSVSYSSVSSSKDALSDITAKEVSERAAGNCDLICTYCTKVYYKTAVSAKEQTMDAPVKDAEVKRRHVRNRLAFNLAMFGVSLGLLGYNFMYWVRFNATDAFVRFTDGKLHDYTTKDHSLWDITYDLRGWFGEYPCVPHIAFFLGMTLLFLPFVVYYFDQYMYARGFEKSLKKKWAKK